MGEGLSFPLDGFDVSLTPGEPARLLRVREVQGAAHGWVLAGFEPAPGFMAAVAVEAPESAAGDAEVCG